MTCILTADLIRATGNAVLDPALQRWCDIVRLVSLYKPCDVTFAGLAARELGHQVAGIKAIFSWKRKTFHRKSKSFLCFDKDLFQHIHDRRI